MQAGVAAVIADVVINMGENVLLKKEIVSTIVMIGAFIAAFFLNMNVVYIILVCGSIGAINVLLQVKKERKAGESR